MLPWRFWRTLVETAGARWQRKFLPGSLAHLWSGDTETIFGSFTCKESHCLILVMDSSILQVPRNHHFLSLVLMLLACCCSIRSYIHQGELCYGVLAVLKQRRSLSVKMWKIWHKLGTAFFSHEISSALGLRKNPGKRWSCTNKHQHPPPLAAVNYLSSHHPVLFPLLKQKVLVISNRFTSWFSCLSENVRFDLILDAFGGGLHLRSWLPRSMKNQSRQPKLRNVSQVCAKGRLLTTMEPI